MARKPRTQRSRPSVATAGNTQVLDYDEDAAGVASSTPAAAPRQRPRPSAYVAPSARVVDYSYVTHDVIRIAIITVVLIGGMIGLSFMMR